VRETAGRSGILRVVRGCSPMREKGVWALSPQLTGVFTDFNAVWSSFELVWPFWTAC
jgi:hypothetical protein